MKKTDGEEGRGWRNINDLEDRKKEEEPIEGSDTI